MHSDARFQKQSSTMQNLSQFQKQSVNMHCLSQFHEQSNHSDPQMLFLTSPEHSNPQMLFQLFPEPSNPITQVTEHPKLPNFQFQLSQKSPERSDMQYSIQSDIVGYESNDGMTVRTELSGSNSDSQQLVSSMTVPSSGTLSSCPRDATSSYPLSFPTEPQPFPVQLVV